MTTPADSTEQPNLLELLKDDLSTLLKEHVDGEVDFEKTWQYMRLRKADMYYRGLQNIAPTYSGGVMDWAQVGSPNSPNTDQEQSGIYDYNIDLVKAYGRKYFASLGLRPFYNSKAMPDDPQSEVDLKAARQAELCDIWLRSKWQAPVRNIEIFYHQWKAGNVFAYTPFVSDADVFGEVEEPQFVNRQIETEPAGYRCPQCGAKSPQPEMTQVPGADYEPVQQPVCPQCKAPISEDNHEDAQKQDVPEFSGNQKYPGSGPALYLCTGYTVTGPFDGGDMNKWPYLLYEYEENRGRLLQMFGDVLRPKMGTDGDLGSSESGITHQQGMLTRKAAQSLTGMYRQGSDSRWTFSRYWLDSSMYEYVKDATKRQMLYESYPDGLKITRVEGVPVKLENEKISSVWSLFKAEPSDTVYTDPQCWGILGHQDAVNDIVNIKIAKEERGLPAIVADPDLLDDDALSNKRFLPKEVVFAKAGFSGTVRDAFSALPTPNKDDGSSGELLQLLDSNVQQHTGLLPPIWGGGEKSQTAEETKTRLNQALMTLGVPGQYASQGWIDAKTNAIRLIAKYAPKGFIVSIPDQRNGDTSEMLDLEALRSGKWHLEAEPGIPMSWAEKKDQINAIITENPQLAMQMGFMSPSSAPAMRDYLLPNMPEIRNPAEDVRSKVIERIQLLLQQQPIPSPMGGPPNPSILPEDYVDDPGQHAELVREWLNSSPGRKLATDPAKQMGYQNVVAYGMLCAMKAQPPVPPGGPEQAGSAPPNSGPSGPGGPPPTGGPPPNASEAPPPVQSQGPNPVNPQAVEPQQPQQ